VFARILNWVGRTMVISGCFILGFVAYQLWGTGVQTSRSQNELTDSFGQIAAGPDVVAPKGDLESIGRELAKREPTTAPPLAAPQEGRPIGIIQIPRIGLTRVIVEGVSKKDLRKGPGHYPSTPLPGQPGNSAIAGHRTTYGAPFNRIDELVPGDEIITTTVQGQFRYRVVPEPGGSGRSWFTVRPDGVQVLKPSLRNQLTLTACHPKYSARQRIVVVAVLSSPAAPKAPAPSPTAGKPAPSKQPEVAEEATLGGEPSELYVGAAFALGALFVGLAGWFLGRRWRRWPAWILTAPFVLALVWSSYVHLDRYLPSL